ncbi:hypothetical protein J5X84_08485 [Streptosporangiaceae bacterium NEAU-GS5]|nr:hypothetical protein [Streptosporangiaceae bacterium NEAU-GS5]
MHVKRHWGAAVAALTALALVSQVLYGVTSAAAWGRPVVVLVQAASIQESSPTKSVVAQCPAGKKVTGGGGGITAAGGATPNQGEVEVTEMRPIAATAFDSFRVTGTERDEGFAGNWSVAAYAICTDPLPGQQVVFNTGPADSNFDRINQISCPDGKRVLGTGARINDGGGQVHIREMGARQPDRDFASVSAGEDADGFDGSWSVTTFAVCVDADAPVTMANAVSRFNANERTKTVTATCPAGTHVLGTSFSGGVPNFDLVVARLAPTDDLNVLNMTMYAPDVEHAWGAGIQAFCSQADVQSSFPLPKPSSDVTVVVPPEQAPKANSPGVWVDVPGLTTAVYTVSGATLTATVSAEIYTVNSVWLRVLVDGGVTSPSDVAYRLAGAEFDGTRSFTFGRESMPAGKHIVQVQWYSNSGQVARIRDRTLSVHSEAGGALAHVAAESDFRVKSSLAWENVPDLTRTVFAPSHGNIKITFSGLTTNSSGKFLARAMVDGQPTEDVIFEDPGVVGGARSYVFVRKDVGAGPHTVAVQWSVDPGTIPGASIRLADRALTVFASPEFTDEGGLVESASQGSRQTVTSTSWVDVSNMGATFITAVPSEDVELTVGMEHQATRDRTFLRALIDGRPVGQSEVELATNVTHTHAQTYTFVAKNLQLGTHTVQVQASVDSGAGAVIGDRVVAVTYKTRHGTDFAQPYSSLAPRVGQIPSVAICFDPRRPGHAPPTSAYLRALHDGGDGGANAQAWYRENTGDQFGFATPTLVGCNDGNWLPAPAGRTGTWYWDTGNFPLMWQDALKAADPFFDFKAYDRDGDNAIGGDELVVEIIRPQNNGDGTTQWASAPLDGFTMNVRVLDLYLSASTDTSHRLVNVGLLVHEGAHDILGAADMYWSNTLRPGRYSVMDNHTQANHFDPFHKLKSGFVLPGLVDTTTLTVRTVPLASVESRREITIVFDPARQDKAYFILENRWGGNGANYDGNLPQGIAVWHIVEDAATMDQFPPPFSGDPAGSGEWGRKGVRLMAVLGQAGQSTTLTYADGTPARVRITAKAGPAEFVDTEIAKI